MKKSPFIFVRLSVLALLILFFFGCEPISVSVNSRGDIAFTRAEGVFFYDAKTGKIVTVNWNHGTPQVPVLVRWSPDNENLAYSAKTSKDSQDLGIYLVAKSGGKPKKLYAVSKVVTQMEWSPDGKYISLAQQGEDSDLGVADLVLINAGDGMSKTIVENCGDVHNWLDAKSIALLKISSKNGDSSDILNGKVAIWSLGGADLQSLVEVKITKTAGLDTNPALGQIAFTALQIGPGSQEFIPKQIDRLAFDADFLPKFSEDDQKTLFANGYDQSKGSYRLKEGLSEELQGELKDLLVSVGYLNNDSPHCFLVKAGEAKAEQMTDVVVNFLQFSPDGRNVLVKAKTPTGSELGTINLAAKSYKQLATDAADTVSANSGSVQVYPSWSGNAAVIYFKEQTVYGSNGMALTLMGIDIASGKKHNLQVAIDAEVAKLVESRGGY